MIRLRHMVMILVVVLLSAFPFSVSAQDLGIANQLQALAQHADLGVAAAQRGDAVAMQKAFDQTHTTWETFEDELRTIDATGYSAIELAFDTIKESLASKPIDALATLAGFQQLNLAINETNGRIANGTATSAPTSSPAAVLALLNTASEALARGDTTIALQHTEAAKIAWPAIEGAIAAKSQADYHAIEDDLGAAISALKATPSDTAKASTTLERLRTTLSPYIATQTYSMFDVAAILLREGLEALLVIVALLSFLRRSGNSDKRAWIWGGGVLGILASVAVAFVLQAIFSSASAGQNRELIEGATGLVAAAMLFYVSYWLHNNASLHAWKRFIDERTTQALARGSVIGLALLAFLAVFREGAETAVFYLGMAPSISSSDLLAGLGIGTITLTIAAVLMLVAGVKLPLRLFFRVAALLVYYLGFKFVGTGIHSLQIAGVLPTSPIGMPAIPQIGIFATWESLIPQILLIAAAVTVFVYLRGQERKLSSPSMAAG
jgi:high-affinity iron transporter